MFRCLNETCEAEFEKPRKTVEYIGGHPIPYKVCPECGESDIEETVPCGQCSEQKPNDLEKYCDKCKAEVSKEISAAIWELKTRWDPELVDQALVAWIENL